MTGTAPQPPRNIVLIGLRGSGKTAVGRQLAAILGWVRIDTDELIEERGGRSIAEIFATEGEAGFRRVEAEVVAEVARGAGQVMSVGGGAVLSEGNRAALRAAGICVWLTAPPEELHARLGHDPRTPATRPPLTERAALDELRHLLVQRRPLYAALADHVVDTTGRSVAQVVDEVLGLLAWPRAGPEQGACCT